MIQQIIHQRWWGYSIISYSIFFNIYLILIYTNSAHYFLTHLIIYAGNTLKIPRRHVIISD